MAIQIKKAVRQRVWLKIAVTGPTGAGKTWGAISVAKGLAPTGKVLVIDTENDSASLYADRWDFDTITIHAPFTTQKYSEALDAALENGYEVVVIDSLTHEWAASGGLLDQKAAKDARGGNSFSNWNEMKQLHNRFVEKLLQAPIHMVGTLRSKMAYAQEQDEKGKTAIRKVGLAPITSDDLEYEFSVVFDVERNTHLAVASKDRTSLFEGRSLSMGEAVGRELAAWLGSAAPTEGAAAAAPVPTPAAKPEPKTAGQVFSQMAPPPASPVPQDVADFVDAIADGPAAPALCTPEECVDITDLAQRQKVNLAQLAAYMVVKGWMKDPKNWTRITKEGHEKILPSLKNKPRGLIAHLNQHFPNKAA